MQKYIGSLIFIKNVKLFNAYKNGFSNDENWVTNQSDVLYSMSQKKITL